MQLLTALAFSALLISAQVSVSPRILRPAQNTPPSIPFANFQRGLEASVENTIAEKYFTARGRNAIDTVRVTVCRALIEDGTPVEELKKFIAANIRNEGHSAGLAEVAAERLVGVIGNNRDEYCYYPL